MEKLSEKMSFTRNELQIIANAVSFNIDNNVDGSTFKDRMDVLIKINEQLDRFTEMEGEI
jgi:hypothetical protein